MRNVRPTVSAGRGRGSMSMIFRIATLAAAVGLSACGTPSGELKETPGGFLPVEALLNGLKCEVQSYAAAHDRSPIVAGRWVIQGELELNVRSEVSAGGSVDALVPIIAVPFFGFGFGAGASDSRARKGTYEFLLVLRDGPQGRCVQDPSDPSKLTDGSVIVESIGLSSWLGRLENISTQGADFEIRKTTYVLTFGVSRNAGADVRGGFKITPLSFKANVAAQRDDVQVLSVALFPPPPKDVLIATTPRNAKGLTGLPGTPAARPDVRRILREERLKLLSGN